MFIKLNKCNNIHKSNKDRLKVSKKGRKEEERREEGRKEKKKKEENKTEKREEG